MHARAQSSVDPQRKPATGLRTLTVDEFRQVIDTAIDGIIVINASGTVLLYNTACVQLFGYSATEVLGSNVNMLMPSPDRESHDTYLENYLRTGRARIIGIGREVTGQRADGSTFPMRLSVGELRGDRDTPLFVGTIHDLTELQRDRERIEELQAKLMRVSRASALGAMSSVLAHELNQPLAAIAGFVEASSELIDQGEGKVSDRIRKYMENAVTQTHRAGSVLRRLREFTQDGVGQRSTEDINAIVKEACAFASLGTATEEIDASMNLATDLPSVWIDRIQIQQVILNLVRNSIDALSNLEHGTISISTTHRDDMVEVAVSDNGPGVAPEIRNRLFEPFVSTKPDGIGIGLYICRTIIETHGGKISLDPESRNGTTFRFTVPVFVDDGDSSGR